MLWTTCLRLEKLELAKMRFESMSVQTYISYVVTNRELRHLVQLQSPQL